MTFQQKRDWKRYDPEPKEPESCDRCSWQEWETSVWVATIIVAIPLLAFILANATGGGA